MAESIIVHFRFATLDAAATAVDRVAERVRAGAEPWWRYPAANDAYTLTIYPYQDLLHESDPEELDELSALLGGALPTVSLAVELRRSRGEVALSDACQVVRKLLAAEPGLVDDTCEHYWTEGEISAEALKGGKGFLDVYRGR